MGGESLRVVLGLARGRLLLRADAALPRLLELRRLRAGVARRHDVRLAAQVLRQRISRRRAAARRDALHVRRRAVPLSAAPAAEPARSRAPPSASPPGRVCVPTSGRRSSSASASTRIIETYGQTEANLSLMNRRGRVGSVGRSAPFTHEQLKLVRFDFERQQPLRGAGRLPHRVPPRRGRRAAAASSRSRRR